MAPIRTYSAKRKRKTRGLQHLPHHNNGCTSHSPPLGPLLVPSHTHLRTRALICSLHHPSLQRSPLARTLRIQLRTPPSVLMRIYLRHHPSLQRSPLARTPRIQLRTPPSVLHRPHTLCAVSSAQGPRLSPGDSSHVTFPHMPNVLLAHSCDSSMLGRLSVGWSLPTPLITNRFSSY